MRTIRSSYILLVSSFIHMLFGLIYLSVWFVFFAAANLNGYCADTSLQSGCVWMSDTWAIVYYRFLYFHIAWILLYARDSRTVLSALSTSVWYFSSTIHNRQRSILRGIALSCTLSVGTICACSLIPFTSIAFLRNIAHRLRHLRRGGCCCGCVSLGDSLWRITASISKFAVVHHSITGDSILDACKNSSAVLKRYDSTSQTNHYADFIRCSLSLLTVDTFLTCVLRACGVATGVVVGLVFWDAFQVQLSFALVIGSACYLIVDTYCGLALHVYVPIV